jgi:hypothetical protein
MPTPMMHQYTQFDGTLDIAFNIVLCSCILAVITFVIKDGKSVPQRILAGLVIFSILRNLTQFFPPEGTTATSEHAPVGALGEFLAILLYVFTTGPIRIFLDTKIGNTSVEKMVEDYQEDRA